MIYDVTVSFVVPNIEANNPKQASRLALRGIPVPGSTTAYCTAIPQGDDVTLIDQQVSMVVKGIEAGIFSDEDLRRIHNAIGAAIHQKPAKPSLEELLEAALAAARDNTATTNSRLQALRTQREAVRTPQGQRTPNELLEAIRLLESDIDRLLLERKDGGQIRRRQSVEIHSKLARISDEIDSMYGRRTVDAAKPLRAALEHAVDRLLADMFDLPPTVSGEKKSPADRLTEGRLAGIEQNASTLAASIQRLLTTPVSPEHQRQAIEIEGKLNRLITDLDAITSTGIDTSEPALTIDKVATMLYELVEYISAAPQPTPRPRKRAPQAAKATAKKAPAKKAAPVAKTTRSTRRKP